MHDPRRFAVRAALSTKQTSGLVLQSLHRLLCQVISATTRSERHRLRGLSLRGVVSFYPHSALRRRCGNWLPQSVMTSLGATQSLKRRATVPRATRLFPSGPRHRKGNEHFTIIGKLVILTALSKCSLRLCLLTFPEPCRRIAQEGLSILRQAPHLLLLARRERRRHWRRLWTFDA